MLLVVVKANYNSLLFTALVYLFMKHRTTAAEHDVAAATTRHNSTEKAGGKGVDFW